MRSPARPFLPALVMACVLCCAASLSAQPADSKGDLGTVIQDFAKMNDGQKDTILSTTGIPKMGGNFSVANLVANLIFSSIGFIAFFYGKKNASWRPTVIGVVLMAYPYVFSSTFLIYAIGIALTASLYFFRE